MSDTDKMGISIAEVRSALESVFKGCLVETPHALGGCHHAELKFNEYEVRVILGGERRGNPDRPIHFRFMQKVAASGRKPIKVMINEVQTTDPKVLATAIRDAKEYLLGIVQSINQALKRKPVKQILDVDDLLMGSD